MTRIRNGLLLLIVGSYCQTNTASYNPCNNGYVMEGTTCVPCYSSRCATCTSVLECDSCYPGNYLEGTSCLQCQPGCTLCSPYNVCSQCRDGFYKSDTECVACSTGCVSQCGKMSGTCNCKPRFTGDKCDACITGYDGESCNRTCPINCKDNTCKYGICSDGCVASFAGSDCKSCFTGLYGENCSKECPRNCFVVFPMCDVFTGHCQRCKPNFSGNVCDVCINGYYGPTCSLPCPVACKDGVCNRVNGLCKSCEEGVYGDVCSIPCSTHCLGETCDSKTGVCKNGCKSGYSGDQCCFAGELCEICSSPSVCSRCVAGKFGDDCYEPCPANCEGGICDKTDGACYKCRHGYSGDRGCFEGDSREICSSSSVCSRCVTGKFGDDCNEQCPANCEGDICDKANGTCEQCVVGFKGAYCSEMEPALIVGGLAAAVGLVVIAVVALVFRRRLCAQWKRTSESDETSAVTLGTMSATTT